MAHVDGEDQALWFLDTRVSIVVSSDQDKSAVSVLRHRAPFGDSPPLHVHLTEDEIFYVLEGQVRFRLGDAEREAAAGDTMFAPKGIPHTYRIESPEGASWLTIIKGDDFERFVRAFSRPADHAGLPDQAPEPTREQAAALAEACRKHGIELVGPPLAPKRAADRQPAGAARSTAAM
jgi:quercetin dioxygenase-like cupin family protein